MTILNFENISFQLFIIFFYLNNFYNCLIVSVYFYIKKNNPHHCLFNTFLSHFSLFWHFISDPFAFLSLIFSLSFTLFYHHGNTDLEWTCRQVIILHTCTQILNGCTYKLTIAIYAFKHTYMHGPYTDTYIEINTYHAK